MSKKTFDKRLAFIATVLNAKLCPNARVANAWYISNKGETISNEEALRRFKEWLQ